LTDPQMKPPGKNWSEEGPDIPYPITPGIHKVRTARPQKEYHLSQ